MPRTKKSPPPATDERSRQRRESLLRYQQELLQEKLALRPPRWEELDRRIYGLRRPTSGEELRYLSDDERTSIRRQLPLKAEYTAFDFTPAGQVALLRQRGYSDAAIVETFPALAAAVNLH